MKSKATIREQFGTTQEEMAMILGVSMSAWSMYESGLRDLPVHATQMLAEMLMHMKAASRPSDHDAKGKQNPALLAQIDALLRDNEFERMRAARQLGQLERRREMAAKRARINNFLKDQKQPRPGIATQLMNNKKYVATDQDAIRAFALARKQALLAFEQSWLGLQREALSNS